MPSPRFPYVDQALVDYLDRLYPDVCPDPSENAQVKYGAVQVVRHLKKLLRDQMRNALDALPTTSGR